ncbi:MAG: hypothetical protein KJO36_08295, partial [Acidimicrobiia bacterium]|nr:hypothetical protein [Acidimicrobiia bacterium]
MKRIWFVFSAVAFGFYLAIILPTAHATEPTDQDLLVTCNEGIVRIVVGPEHRVGMSSYRVDGDDGTFKHFDWWTPLRVGGASWVDVWITIDGKEVDPRVYCTPKPTTTTTTRATTTTPPTTSTTTTKPTVPTT